MSKLVVYLAHPVIGNIVNPTPEQVAANLDSAMDWLQWLVDHTQWAIQAPWYPYVMRLSRQGQYGYYRERGLEDDCAAVERCDAIFCAGGHITNGLFSSGMEREVERALKTGVVVGDVMHLPAPPPIGVAAFTPDSSTRIRVTAHHPDGTPVRVNGHVLQHRQVPFAHFESLVHQARLASTHF